MVCCNPTPTLIPTVVITLAKPRKILHLYFSFKGLLSQGRLAGYHPFHHMHSLKIFSMGSKYISGKYLSVQIQQ